MLLTISNNKLYLAVLGISLILFLLAGYVYPASQEDILRNVCNGKYERAVFTQFMTSLAFTMSMLLLGYYVNSTFVNFGVKHWKLFSAGIYFMFLYGLGKIGELIFSHHIFEAFKDIVLPVALIILAHAMYKISTGFTGDEYDGS